ncbi:hypothetical protein [Acidithrix ferrooxidans]|uniref:Uncharacterized protein n=1 Tax=Acidithrix ferrooxidans TaxID=1280514 RepID=A0A0D8HIG8_9ACTN|nr:hypothetical protein [Acidithrix ferrooxidans]KJF17785.1 hypothetical protein AXFE_12820 [Acidithrix ferrooxidans]
MFNVPSGEGLYWLVTAADGAVVQNMAWVIAKALLESGRKVLSLPNSEILYQFIKALLYR